MTITPATVLALAISLISTADMTYTNRRFGYSVDYPARLLHAEPEAANGDGRHFLAADRRTDMLVWASENVLAQTQADLLREAEQSCAARPAAYRVAKPNLVAVSCLTSTGELFYRKTLIRGDMLTSFQITYPMAERATWDGVVSQIARSMRAATP